MVRRGPARTRRFGRRAGRAKAGHGGHLHRESVPDSRLPGERNPPPHRQCRAGNHHPSARPALGGRAFSPGCAGGCVPYRGQSRRGRSQPLWARLWATRDFPFARAAVLSGVSCRHESRGLGGRCFQFPAVVGIHVALFMGAGDGASSFAGESARRICLYPDGEFRHAGVVARVRLVVRTGWKLRVRRHPQRQPGTGRVAGSHPGSDRRRIESRSGAAACLAAPRPSGGAKPCFGADERRDDQGGGLRLRAHHLRSRWHSRLVVGTDRAVDWRRHRRHGRALRADGARSQTCSCLQHD